MSARWAVGFEGCATTTFHDVGLRTRLPAMKAIFDQAEDKRFVNKDPMHTGFGGRDGFKTDQITHAAMNAFLRGLPWLV